MPQEQVSRTSTQEDRASNRSTRSTWAGAGVRGTVTLEEVAAFSAEDSLSYEMYMHVMDAVSVAAIPTLIVGAAAAPDAQCPVIYANGAFVTMTAQSLDALTQQTLADVFVRGSVDHAAAVQRGMQVGCEFQVPECELKDVYGAAQPATLLLLPITDVRTGTGPPNAYLMLVLTTLTPALHGLLVRLPTVSQLSSNIDPLYSLRGTCDMRVGLYQVQEASCKAAKLREYHNMLVTGGNALGMSIANATERRRMGLAPVRRLPLLLDVPAWLQHLRMLLTTRHTVPPGQKGSK